MKNDHKKLKSLAVLWLIVLAPLMGLVPMLPSVEAYVTVDNSASHIRAVQASPQRKILYDGERWWAFYYNGSHVVYRSSTDLISWSAAANFSSYWLNSDDLRTSGTDFEFGHPDTIYNKTILSAVSEFSGGTFNVRYRSGTINGSTINWGSTWSVTSTGFANGPPKVVMSTTSRIWVIFGEDLNDRLDAYYSDFPIVGWTWTGTAGNTASTNYYGADATAMTAGKIFAVWHNYSGNNLVYSIWNGGWGAIGSVGSDSVIGTYPGGFSLVADGSNADRQFLVYKDTSNDIKLKRYNSGWEAAEAVTTGVNADSVPTITYDNVNDEVIVGWFKDDILYTRTRYSNGTWKDIVEVEDFSAVNSAAPQDLTSSVRDWDDQVVYMFATGNANPYNVTIATLDVPVALSPQGSLELSGLKCGDIWVTPDKTYLTVTATIQAQTAIQNVSVRFNDSLNVIQADYDNTTARWNLSQGRDVVSLNSQATVTSNYTAAGGPLSTDNYTLQVAFMFLANERILDRNDVDIEYEYSLQNGSLASWTSNATMNIYNKGGATEYYIQNDAGFLAGPDVYSVYAKNTSSIGVNQTWVRLQHLHANFGIRLILNSTDSGEDNLWQDLGHKGTNEYYTNSTDWTIYYKIWYYDEQNEEWVQGWILSFVKQQGDIGTSDEWTEFNVTFYNGPNSEKTSSQNMSAWVEREPEARVRLWIDLWFNKINASSVHGARMNPMYFGIHYTGWAMWGTAVAGQWEPMYKNETQAAAFDNLQDANGVENITSPMLTCMKTEQILVMNENTYNIAGMSPLNYNYTLQITNWDVFEPKLSPTRNMEGVNTPLIVEPLLPDKTATSFWAPIYAGLQSIGGFIFKAFASLAEIVWQAVRTQFPWFAEWVDNVNALLANGIEASNQMLSGLVELLKMVGGQVWIFGFITDFIQQTWEYLYPLLSPFTENATVWLTLLVIVFGILPIADNLTRGRWDLVQDDLERVWGFMRTVIVGIYVIVTTLVNWLISAIPL